MTDDMTHGGLMTDLRTAAQQALEAGTPSDNSMSYCCYCGSVIKEVQA